MNDEPEVNILYFVNEIKNIGFTYVVLSDVIIYYFQSQCNGVVEWLQSLCTNDVNIPVGGIVHTGMLNERGGYENDCLLVRERENW